MKKDGYLLKKIELQNGLVTLIDAEDYWKVKDYHWYAAWDNHTDSWRVVANKRKDKGKYTLVQLSRVIMDPKPGEHVDHRNHDTLDNRKENLRCCSPTENRRNCRPMGSSKYKGVSKHGNGWIAQATFEKEKIYLGFYKDDKDAAKAYDIFASSNYGEFAWLNQEHYPEDFIDEIEEMDLMTDCEMPYVFPVDWVQENMIKESTPL